MKKILFICSSSAGGAERMTVLYSKILKNNGFDCSFLITLFPNCPVLVTQFIPSNIKSKIVRLRYSFFIIIKLFINILRINPDIIFCSQPGNSLYLLKLKKYHLISSKFVYREFLMPSNHKNGIDERSKYLKYADLLIAQTEEMKNEMMKYYNVCSDKVLVINNPLDIDFINLCIQESYPFDSSYTNYVALNRISPQKDIMTMLQAFEIVRKKEPLSRLYICGDVSDKQYFNSLTSFIEKHDMKEYVFFEGPQKNPYKYLNKADVFCLSSIYEGLPNALLEAMFLGIPVAVTSSIPFIEQIVSVGKHGYLSKTRDVCGFADAMYNASKMAKYEKYKDPIASSDIIVDTFKHLL